MEIFVKGMTQVDVVQNGAVKIACKTATSNTMSFSVDAGEIRGGFNDSLLIQIPHDAALEGTLEMEEFNLEGHAIQLGSTIQYGAPVEIMEACKLEDGKITLTNTPEPMPGHTVAYAYVDDGNVGYDCTTGSFDFDGEDGKSYCVRYCIKDETSELMPVDSNFVGSIGSVFMRAAAYATNNASDAAAGTRIGTLYTFVPNAQFTGEDELANSQTEHTKTTMKWKALTYQEAVSVSSACSTASERYCYIWLAIDARKWYDIAKSLVILDEIACSVGGTDDIAVKGVDEQGRLLHPTLSDLVYTLEPTDIGSVTNGVFTAGSAAKTGTLTVKTKDGIANAMESQSVSVTVLSGE